MWVYKYTTAWRKYVSVLQISPVVDDAADGRTMREAINQQESFNKSFIVTFQLLLFHLNCVGEQCAVVKEEWPQQPYERRSLEPLRARARA